MNLQELKGLLPRLERTVGVGQSLLESKEKTTLRHAKMPCGSDLEKKNILIACLLYLVLRCSDISEMLGTISLFTTAVQVTFILFISFMM